MELCKNRKLFALLAAVLLIAGAFAVLFIKQGETEKNGNNFMQENSGKIIGCIDLNRQSYNLAQAVFESLPSPPKCFASIMQLRNRGEFSDDFFFTKEFFLQPEFYPVFLQNGMEYWTSPTATHWGAIGFGCFPYEKTIKIKPGSAAKTRLFLHAGFGVRTFQGMRIVPEFENSEDAEFVKITLDRESEEGFLLGPAFPKFDSGWAKAIDAEIGVLKNPAKKTIKIFLKTKSPEEKQALEWQKKYANYYNATDFVGEKIISSITISTE
ncbi:MAG: hypothetical protein PHH08_03770 [Candidatus ainarchaeum sp.]|nr:hypothetical protein [Candidatus ainarchaeum sp.]